MQICSEAVKPKYFFTFQIGYKMFLWSLIRLIITVCDVRSLGFITLVTVLFPDLSKGS